MGQDKERKQENRDTKKYVESVLGNDKVDFNDSVIEQIAELYLEKLASSNINISNVMVDDLVKNEDLVWSCYDEYIKMPNKRTVSNYEPPIDLMIKSRMYNERMYGTIGNDELGVDDEEYNEGRSM